MRNPNHSLDLRSLLLLLILLVAVGFLNGCKKGDDTGANDSEEAYVSAPQVALRDRVAAVYNKVGYVANGERVRVLERSSNKRFLRVRTEDGKEGWVEQRFLVGPDVYKGFATLANENAQAVSQATAVTRRLVNLHVEASRDSDSLYQLKDGTKVELLKRASTPKEGLKAAAKEEKAKAEEEKEESSDAAEEEKKPAKKESKPTTKTKYSKKQKVGKRILTPAIGSPLEDWWLVRDPQKHVGWLLGRMLDVDIPLEIAQYAEGQRIIASFILSEVEVPDETAPRGKKKVPQYAVLMTEPRDGMPFDFNQLRVFTWNTRRSRYETAYRERFEGQLPFLVTKEDFGKEGTLPVFTVHIRDAEGNLQERKYKMNGVIVRRIQAPGEPSPPRPVRRSRRK